MHGDRRPYPVVLITLDEEEIVAVRAASTACRATSPRSPAPRGARADPGRARPRQRASYAQVEQVKKFVILDHDLSQETGELTPTLKVKRNVVNEKYADLFDSLYELSTLQLAPSLTDEDRSHRQRRPVRRPPPRHAAGPLPRRCPSAAAPARQRVDSCAGRAPCSSAMVLDQPALLGPAPARCGCGSAVRSSSCDRQRRRGHRGRVRRPVGDPAARAHRAASDLDNAWILVRRAAGHDQREGMIGRSSSPSTCASSARSLFASGSSSSSGARHPVASRAPAAARPRAWACSTTTGSSRG